MAYIVLARKWRPMQFEDVLGQEHITKILSNALKNKRIAHAYIFAGPRGVGKTSTARLLAKAVNCEKQPAVNPCNDCHMCKSITNGQNLDVIEIDGASNRGIDEIRNLRENIRFTPAAARYKIYIIDEVHMLTKEAFNALLKTLEEPPAHAIFIFATTEIHRVPLTILSRCQRFDFKRIALPIIQKMLKKITTSEKINIDDEALLLIARKADGSMRDAESILDQMVSFNADNLTAEQVRNSLGLIDLEIFFEFTEMLKERDTAKILEYCKKVFSSGHDLVDYLHGLQEHFRNLLLTIAMSKTTILEVPDHIKERYKKSVSQLTDKDIIHILNILGDSEQRIKYSFFPELSLEMILLKIAFKPSSIQIEELLKYLERTGPPSPAGGDSQTRAPVKPDQDPKAVQATQSTDQKKFQLNNQQNNIPDQKSELKNTDGFQGLEVTLKNIEQFNKTDVNPKIEKSPQIEYDLNYIKAKWPDIVNQVRAHKIALGSFLEEGVPYAAEQNRLVIAYDNASSFHQEHVEKNRKVIENILKRDFQLAIQIGFKSIDFKSAGIAKQPRTPEEVVEDIKNKEPIIKKIIDVFGLDESLSTS